MKHLSLVILFLSTAMLVPVMAAQTQVLRGVVASGDIQTYTAESEITTATQESFVVLSGARVTLRAGKSITLFPGFHAEQGSNVIMTIESAGGDSTPPIIVDGYPPESQSRLVGSQGRSLTLLYIFSDSSGSNVSAKLLDANTGQIITEHVTVSSDSLEYLVENPLSGEYHFTLVLTDASGNEVRKDIQFVLDTDIPQTTVDVAGKVNTGPVTVHFNCTENAKLYYSTDGYPPYVGASNTTELNVVKGVQSAGIPITRTTRLQFFAVDLAGNIEPTNSEVYLFDNVVGIVSGLTGSYVATSDWTELHWTAVTSSQGYYLYRCLGAIDCRILDESRIGGYPAPARFRIQGASISATGFVDEGIAHGITYRYGVSALSSEGVEGLVSELVSVEIPDDAGAQSVNDAITRAKVWLKANQRTNGAWGDTADQEILATSQALLALHAAQEDDAGVRDGLFFLRGHNADNNDFLARSVKALAIAGQNVDLQVTQLVSRANIAGASVLGWGIQKRYKYDAVDTALAISALKNYSRPLKNSQGGSLVKPTLAALNSMQIPATPTNTGGFSWISGIGNDEPSIFVSALAYGAMGSPAANYSWILTNQSATNDSFGDSITDTAAVLLWLDLSAAGDVRTRGAKYLVSMQSADGSWAEDPYLTALCLEALLRQ